MVCLLCPECHPIMGCHLVFPQSIMAIVIVTSVAQDVDQGRDRDHVVHDQDQKVDAAVEVVVEVVVATGVVEVVIEVDVREVHIRSYLSENLENHQAHFDHRYLLPLVAQTIILD